MYVLSLFEVLTYVLVITYFEVYLLAITIYISMQI